MNKQELKSEQKRLKGKIQQLESIADVHEPAVLEIEFLKEELKWIEIQLSK